MTFTQCVTALVKQRHAPGLGAAAIYKHIFILTPTITQTMMIHMQIRHSNGANREWWGDALLSFAAGSRAIEAAAPSASRRQIIDTHRRAVITTANKALRNKASCTAHVLAIEADEDTVHGRSHFVPLAFPLSLRSSNNLFATRLCSFSRHLREESRVDDSFVCCEFAPNLLNRRGTGTERFSKLCEGETKRGYPLLVPQPITRRCSDASARAAASTRREPKCLSTFWLKCDQRDLSVR